MSYFYIILIIYIHSMYPQNNAQILLHLDDTLND